MTTSCIPLHDFLAANRLGKGDLRFGTVDHAAGDDENGSGAPRKKATVDATRLALMVAESYVRRHKSGLNYNGNNRAAPLDLDCIYLVVPSESENNPGHATDYEGIRGEGLIVLSDTDSSFRCGDDFKEEILGDANFDPLSMSQLRQDDGDEFEIDILGVLNEAGIGQKTSSNRGDVLDSAPEIDNDYKVRSARGDYPFRTPDGDFEKNEVTRPTPTTTSQTTTCSPGPSSVDAILGVEIATMENEIYAEIEFHAALRMLGRVLQQIFLSTVPEAGQATSQKDASEHQDRRVDFQRRSRRVPRPRLGESTVFSSLSEQLPFSVCRLLSDMIEPALMPEDGVRIETFFQVVDDLLSMSESPSLYLLDPSADFHSSLVFGQRCHGRKDELTSLLGVATRIEECTRRGDDIGKAQAVFVSGKGGSGKSHLVGHVSTFISEVGGWNVYRAKFRRGAVHESKDIVSVLFNCVVMDIVAMKDSENREDVEYSRAVSSAIIEVIGNEGLRVLSGFIPSISKLVEVDPGQGASCEAEDCERPYSENDMKESYSRVSHLVSALVAVIAKERLICLCFDDLQWAESSTLAMLRQIIISVGQDESSRQRFLFLGMYRDDEINDGHPLASEINIFRDSSSVDMTLLELSPLSKSDIMNMVMSETRLTRRHVKTLVDVVHKVTIGHAIFVTQLLQSLVRDSIISYSPLKHRFDWSDRVLESLSMGGDVASLVVENLSSLQPGALKSLEVLSCFGIQVSLQTVTMLQGCSCLPEEGIEPYLDELVGKGVLSREVSLSSLVFSHDLIQQHIYENIPSEERISLHLEIGTHLGSVLSLDSLMGAPFSRVAPQYPFITAAVNQINSSGLSSCDTHQRLRFAQWNALAGKQSWDRSNCDAGLNYFKFGISFLGDAAWQNESQNDLCRLLHEGAAACSFTLGENKACLRYASDIISNAAFDVSLVGHYLYIRSLETLGRFSDGLNHSLGVFEKLGFHFPTQLSPRDKMNTLERTKEAIYSKTFEELTEPHQHMPALTRNVYKLMDACYVSANRIGSPILPILTCSIINFSLENGLCGESCCAYILLGVFRMSLGKYDEIPYYTRIVLAVLDSSPSISATIRRTRMMCYVYLSILHFPFKETEVLLRTIANEALRSGDAENAYESLRFISALSVLTGEKLSTVLVSIDNVISHMTKAKKMKQSLQLVLLDKLLVTSLMSSDEVGPTIDALIEKHKTTNQVWDMELTLYTRFFVAFWNEEHETALFTLNDLLSMNLKVQLKYVYFKFYHGIIAFQQYRNGEGEEWLDQGKDCLEKFKVWSSLSAANFESKLLILEAEYQASEADISAAKTMFQSAARVARNNGLINDQALACKLYGQFLISIVEYQEAISWLNLSKSSFKDWGATRLQEKVENKILTLIEENNLQDVETSVCNLKHVRGW